MKNKSAGIGDGSLSKARNKTPGISSFNGRTPPKTNLVQSELIGGQKDRHCHGAKDFQKRDSLNASAGKNLPKTGSTMGGSGRSRTPVKKSGVSQNPGKENYNKGVFDSPSFVKNENLITLDLNDSPVQRIEVHQVHEIPNSLNVNLGLRQSNSKTVGKTPTRGDRESRVTPEKDLRLTPADSRFFSNRRGEEHIVDQDCSKHGGGHD